MSEQARIGLIYEPRERFPFAPGEPDDASSELLDPQYVDELSTALSELGLDVERVPLDRFVSESHFESRRWNFAFNMSKGYHGAFKKSLVPTVLELRGIPYVGSDPYVLSFVRNKAHLKSFAGQVGVPVPRFAFIRSSADFERLNDLSFPCLVKPCWESASIGINRNALADDIQAAEARTEWVLQHYEQPAIVEEYMPGREYSVPIVGNFPASSWGAVELTLDGKSLSGRSFLTSDVVAGYEYGFELPCESSIRTMLEPLALKLYSAVGFRDYGRMDFRLSEAGRPFLIDASTHPHIGSHSEYLAVAKDQGLGYVDVVRAILNAALARYRFDLI